MFCTRSISAILPGNARAFRKQYGEYVSQKEIAGHVRKIQADTLALSFQTSIGLADSGSVSRQENIANALWHWCKCNWSSSKIDINICHNMLAVLIAWLLPDDMRHGRSQPNMWKLATTLAALNGLWDLKSYNSASFETYVSRSWTFDPGMYPH